MPTIKINEQDLSWYYRQRQPGQMTVLMPGVATFGPCSATEGSLAYVNEDNFVRTLGDSSVDSADLSYQMAKSFVKSGIDVLFWRVPLDGMKYAGYTFTTVSSTTFTTISTGATSYNIEGRDIVVNKAIVFFNGKQYIPTPTATPWVVDGVTKGVTVTFSAVDYGDGVETTTPPEGASIQIEYKHIATVSDYVADTGVCHVEGVGVTINKITKTAQGSDTPVELTKYKVSTWTAETALGTEYPKGITITFNTDSKPLATDTIKVEYSEAIPTLEVKAKYTGTFGNSLSIKAVPAGNGIYRFLVYGKQGTSTVLLETLIVSFTDMNSEYYYETVNRTTDYIQFEPQVAYITSGTHAGEAYSTIDQFIPVSDAFCQLTGGANGIYSVDAVTDYLASKEATSTFNDLVDPLSYVFNVVVSAGYNNYHRYIFDKDIIAADLKDSDTVINIKGVVPDINNIENEITVYATYETEEEGVKVRKPHLLTMGLGTGEWTYDLGAKAIKIHNNAGSEDPTYVPAINDYIKVIVNKDSYSNLSQIDDKFIGLCETTGLAIYIVDGARNFSAEDFFNYTDLPTDQSGESGVYSARGFNTSYAAAIGPWCSALLTSNGVTRTLPGSYVLLIQWAQSIIQGAPPYYAPAGVKRASLNFVSSTEYPVGSAVLELWQNQEITTNNSHKIIPITNLRQYGYVIYGNSTLLKTLSDGSTSMLQSLSTRILANMIKARAFDISLSLQFDQISADLFIQFREQLNQYMSQLKYNNALYDYQIVADTTNLTLDDLNSRTVPVKIRISPTPAAENFVIDLEISQAGIVFSADSMDTVTEIG